MEFIIKPIPITKVKTDKSIMTYLVNIGATIELGTFAWAINHGTTKVLVDTGCPADIQTSSGFPAEQIYTLKEGLATIGWHPEDVDLVIFTHLHLDHIAYAKELKNATFIIQKKEHEAALNPHPAYRGFYNTDLIKQVLENLNVEYINGEKELLKGISVMHTPGHSPGGQTVLIESKKGIIAITGFCCIRENFEPPKGTASISKDLIVPGLHINIIELYESMVKIKEIADIIIPIHDKVYFNIKHIP